MILKEFERLAKKNIEVGAAMLYVYDTLSKVDADLANKVTAILAIRKSKDTLRDKEAAMTMAVDELRKSNVELRELVVVLLRLQASILEPMDAMLETFNDGGHPQDSFREFILSQKLAVNSEENND